MTHPPIGDSSLIVAEAAAIDRAWVQRLLDRRGIAARVSAVQVVRLGSGLAGSSFRMLIEYSGGPASAAPSSLYLKLPSTEAAVRESLASGYAAEINCYQQLIPRLGMQVPGCWLAAFNPQSSVFTLVLDDAYPSRGGDQIAGVSVSRLAAPIVQLSILHARHWNGAQLDGTQDWLLPFYSRHFSAQPVIAAAWERAQVRYAEQLSAEERACGHWLVQRYVAWQQHMKSPLTLVHADYRLENLLLDSDGALRGVVDWQCVSLAPGAIDLAYLIAGSLSLPARRAAESSLVADYHRAVTQRGVSGYAFEDCWRDYRYGAVHGLVMMLLASFSITEGYSHKLFLTLLKRHFQHAIDMRITDIVS